ncbi:hypothetical protein DLAC_11847 [Tieghemostelium lacteum]|uniref:Uncharacterized protein n=1 Tax=Tieghemostelium lacteum TaxID=361077 RepID=A0A151Z2H3_TIELA|nr:hypothetical protein DLAC_11847 [Tieghemostelium lacteum]|eukprot:KYQ88161.1 hypothetical protein DLAC_11847 [Tieghemostelium lacteum]
MTPGLVHLHHKQPQFHQEELLHQQPQQETVINNNNTSANSTTTTSKSIPVPNYDVNDDTLPKGQKVSTYVHYFLKHTGFYLEHYSSLTQ